MRSHHAGLVTVLVTLAVTSVAHAGRRVDIDPAALGTPMVSPPIEVRLEGQPSALGIQCDNLATASSTHDPVLEWRLTAATPSLRVSIDGARAAVHDVRGTWWCSDAHGELTITGARAGDYRLYVLADDTKATVTLRLEAPAQIKRTVESARDRAPTITMGAGSSPNPELRKLTATRAGQARDLALCVGDRETFTPIARVVVTNDLAQLHVAERIPRTIGGRAAILQLVDGAGHCVAPGAVKAGTYALWAEIELDRAPAAIWVELDDTARPLSWPDAPDVDLAKVGDPLVDDGKIAAPAPRPSRATTRCKPVAGPPSFYLDAAAPQAGINVVMVWSRRSQWFLIDGPGLSKCSADGGRIAFDATAGRYAVWAGGDVGADFMFLIHRSGATISAVTTYTQPPGDLTLAERVLPHFYPFFDLGPDATSARTATAALFAAASDRIFVYARSDLGTDATSPRAGEPLILLAVERDDADVLTHDGRTLRVSAKALTIARPKSITLPADADPAVQQRFGQVPASNPPARAPAPAPAPPPGALVQPFGAPCANCADTEDALPAVDAAQPPAPPAVTPTPLDSEVAIQPAGPPEPPRPRTIELGLAFPVRSRVNVASSELTGESIALDAGLFWRIGARLHVGGALGVVRWRNDFTASSGGTSGVYRGVALVRYDIVDTGYFRPYVTVGLGLGVSDMTPRFVIYDLRNIRGMNQMTAIDSSVGLAETYEMALGLRREVEGGWAFLAEVAYSGTRMSHHMVFTDGLGATESTDSVSLDNVDLRLGVELGF